VKDESIVSPRSVRATARDGLLRRAALLAIVAALLTAVVTQFLPRVYRAEAKILPSDAGGALPFADLLAGTDLSAMIGGRGGGENTVLTYPEILLSRPVLDKTLGLNVDSSGTEEGRTVLTALRVTGRTVAIRLDRGIKKLRKIVAVRPNPRSGIISITVDTNNPALSALIANGLIENLNHFNLGVRESRGRAVREFIEGRRRETKAALERSEQDLTRFLEANLRIGNSPQLILEQQRLQRQIDIQSELYRMLERQYEQARIEEHRDTPTFTILESASPPVRKYRPSTILNSASAGAACIAVVFVLSLVDPKSLFRRILGT